TEYQCSTSYAVFSDTIRADPIGSSRGAYTKSRVLMPQSINPSRRKFVKKTLTTTAGAIAFPGLLPKTDSVVGAIPTPGNYSYNITDEVRKFRKIDAYCTAEPNMEIADKLGIDRMFVGKPMRWLDWTPEEFRAANDEMIALMQKYPGRVIGQISVNPLFRKESLEEIDRCVDRGMVGSR